MKHEWLEFLINKDYTAGSSESSSSDREAEVGRNFDDIRKWQDEVQFEWINASPNICYVLEVL